MGYCFKDCGKDYTCTNWDGKGDLETVRTESKCPDDVASCPYRKRKIPTGGIFVRIEPVEFPQSSYRKTSKERLRRRSTKWQREKNWSKK
jgi:hypothetical protein